MKTLYKLKFVLLSLAITAIVACSETKQFYTSEPVITDMTFFPTNLGSYWVYEVYQLDSLGIRVKGNPITDSVVIAPSIIKLDQTAFVFATYRTTNGRTTKSGEEYYYIKDNKLYTFSNVLGNLFGNAMIVSVLGIEDKWVLFIDPNDELWRLYKKELTGASSIPVLNVVGKVDVICSKEFEKNISVGAGTYKAQEYLFTPGFVGTIKALNYAVPTNFQRNTHTWYAENVGLVKSLSESTALVIPLVGEFKVAGEEKNLLRYYIAK